MRVPLHRLVGVAAAALFLASASTAQAQGKGKDKDKNKNVQTHVQGDDRHRDDRHRDDRVYDRRGEHDPRYDQAGRKAIPPGLAKKPGGMPPGQYKKLYSTDHGASVLRDVLGRRGYTVVRTADAGTSEYVYYRAHDGTIRRAIVSPGTDRLRFSNVPSSLLTEVLSRLY